ncbi:MAG: hypothetical protein A3A24_00155 [Candidatus Buchananbacteria bacterium RIFCSPLOWO2_01_FULL_46_12]|uniref:Uncharacterized protein n=1 Tax=Candidatus Buchananbacteria bacterium RIFCSPLOWO2_01_FULL_46_12 TaxID=1797546 RepID=A0A1G1YN68_9BACT|nr:MAG: hypothetical protein A3A24_00155 [Candidatus Buchananbacteria bacterium RIFCSPLOWO2_01_FULL_46_12]
MRILKMVQGFTTNSSGSYEWLPLGDLFSNNQSTTASTTASDAGEIKLDDYQFSPKNVVGLTFLLLSVLSGLVAVVLITKEMIKKIRSKKGKL